MWISCCRMRTQRHPAQSEGRPAGDEMGWVQAPMLQGHRKDPRGAQRNTGAGPRKERGLRRERGLGAGVPQVW